MEIDITHSPTQEEISAVYNGLVEFNAPYFPGLRERKIAGFVRDAGGQVVGVLPGLSCLQVFT